MGLDKVKVGFKNHEFYKKSADMKFSTIGTKIRAFIDLDYRFMRGIKYLIKKIFFARWAQALTRSYLDFREPLNYN